jgi:pyruvate dehydrogenase E1 component alpha subunit
MLEIRAVEEAIQGLFNDGHVRGSTHLSIGQEAVAVGMAAATRPTDVFTATYRGHGVALALGVTPEEVLGEICGRVVGCAQGIGGSMHLVGVDVGLFPTSAIVGGGLPVATGAALTAQTVGSDDVAVAVCGDGATNIGAFHESLNLASIWKLPVVFVVENNLYGEYSRII